MSAKSSSSGLRLSVRAAGPIYILAFSLTLASTGCMHRRPLDQRVFSLEGTAEFPIMAPSNPRNSPGNDFQKYQFELAGKGGPAYRPLGVNCTISGNVFSLAPAKSSDPRLWVVTSLNMPGWQRRADTVDLESEWRHFAEEVLSLHQSGCFPKDESPQELLRQISEAIPVPASEELLYNYSLARTGFVDLVPGMRLIIERASFRSRTGASVPASGANQFSECLEVVPRSPSGSALRLAGTVSRGLGKMLETEADSPRSVLQHFAASSSLRVMLFTLGNDNVRRFPVLLGSTKPIEIWKAADRIAGGTLTECPPSSSSGLECLFFDRNSTVSVLMSVWVNGHRSYRPPGTTVGSLLGRLPENEEKRALATVSMERPVVGGGFARVNFPHDLDGASKVILLNGDRLTWRR